MTCVAEDAGETSRGGADSGAVSILCRQVNIKANRCPIQRPPAFGSQAFDKLKHCAASVVALWAEPGMDRQFTQNQVAVGVLRPCALAQGFDQAHQILLILAGYP